MLTIDSTEKQILEKIFQFMKYKESQWNNIFYTPLKWLNIQNGKFQSKLSSSQKTKEW